MKSITLLLLTLALAAVVEVHADDEGAERFVRQFTSDNPIAVFSKSYCPYCKKAKEALQSVGAGFMPIELDQISPEEAAEIQAALLRLTGRRTVPNVFLYGKSIGGGDDVAALAASGKLKRMIDRDL